MERLEKKTVIINKMKNWIKTTLLFFKNLINWLLGHQPEVSQQEKEGDNWLTIKTKTQRKRERRKNKISKERQDQIDKELKKKEKFKIEQKNIILNMNLIADDNTEGIRLLDADQDERPIKKYQCKDGVTKFKFNEESIKRNALITTMLKGVLNENQMNDAMEVYEEIIIETRSEKPKKTSDAIYKINEHVYTNSQTTALFFSKEVTSNNEGRKAYILQRKDKETDAEIQAGITIKEIRPLIINMNIRNMVLMTKQITVACVVIGDINDDRDEMMLFEGVDDIYLPMHVGRINAKNIKVYVALRGLRDIKIKTDYNASTNQTSK